MPLFKVNKDGRASKQGMIKYNSERELQNFFQDNLEELLGVKFVATEFSTGETHGGRIDTIGIDKENNPVIIGYKLSQNDNVLNQGLYYMDWLYDHKGDFESAVKKKLGNDQEITWDNPKLIIIAQEYSKFDKHAVNRVRENVYLYKYYRYEDDSVYLENISTVSSAETSQTVKASVNYNFNKEAYTLENLYDRSSKEMIEIFNELKEAILKIDDNIEERITKNYVGYSTTRIFAEIHLRKSKIEILIIPTGNYNSYLEIEKLPDTYKWVLNSKFSISKLEEMAEAMKIIKTSYEETL